MYYITYAFKDTVYSMYAHFDENNILYVQRIYRIFIISLHHRKEIYTYTYIKYPVLYVLSVVCKIYSDIILPNLRENFSVPPSTFNKKYD